MMTNLMTKTLPFTEARLWKRQTIKRSYCAAVEAIARVLIDHHDEDLAVVERARFIAEALGFKA